MRWLITDQYSARYRAVYQTCEYDRYGYRMITEMLNNCGWHLKHKRLEWIRRCEKLKAPNMQNKKERLWMNGGSSVRIRNK